MHVYLLNRVKRENLITCSMAVDTAQGVISHIQADFADKRDSQQLPELTVKVQQRLQKNELRMNNLLADTGYSNGANYEFSGTAAHHWMDPRVWDV